ncbi:MAG: winged helix-turn-helix domain-containing protein [archaeon]
MRKAKTVKEKFTDTTLAKILFALEEEGECNQQELSYSTRITYYRVHQLVKDLDKSGLISKKMKNSKESVIKLTEKGQRISHHVKQMKKIFEEDKEVEENGKSKEHQLEE